MGDGEIEWCEECESWSISKCTGSDCGKIVFSPFVR